jgi:ferric-dicitrate binding protein FerR (iron transport regulator)
MDKFLPNELLQLLEKARAGNATGDDYSRIAAILHGDQTGELIAQADIFLGQENPIADKHIEPYNYDYWQQAFMEMMSEVRNQKSEVSRLKAEVESKKRETSSEQSEVRPTASIIRLPALRRWLVAASVIGLLCVGAYFFLIKTKHTQPATASSEILPGKEGAILTLADGSKVLLDNIQNGGVVAMQGGTTAKIVNGTLMYEGSGSTAVYNTMSTPKARKFHVILPDGTNAWLNSASSIRYPTTFTGNERQVEVTGEVYFEVATLRLPSGKKMPFRLNVNNLADIEVLGTHFNVKAYDNEPVINTTLIEGSVRIVKRETANGIRQTAKGNQSADESKNAIILKPGQQAQIRVGEESMKEELQKNAAAKKTARPEIKPGVTVINNSNIEKVMAWKNGVFDFNNIAFDDAMYQLERWYDIEVVYEKGIPTNVELSGKITKDVTLNELVTILEKVGLKCRLQGRKLLIQS